MGQLEERSGVSVPYISKLENGVISSPGAEKLRLLARALDLSIDDLTSDKPLGPAPTVGRVLRTDDLELPVYRAHAGRLDVGPQGPVDTFRIRSHQTYMVEVNGECLQDDGIDTGDVLIIDRSLAPSPKHRVIVVRVGDEIYLAKWQAMNGKIKLHLSDGMDREFWPNEIEIQGVAMYVMKRVTG
jgi:transcriptional regulator with XRE-family HTH domain